MSEPNAGWYADPEQPGSMRWWDGTAWGPTAPPKTQRNGDGITSFVFGILAIASITLWSPNAITFITGLLALLFGLIGARDARSLPTAPKWPWIAGLTLVGATALGSALLS